MSETTSRKRTHNITACLLAQGWVRDDSPFDWVGECTDVSGCSRADRWSHPYRQGSYCAQHAHADNCVAAPRGAS